MLPKGFRPIKCSKGLRPKKFFSDILDRLKIEQVFVNLLERRTFLPLDRHSVHVKIISQSYQRVGQPSVDPRPTTLVYTDALSTPS